MVFLTILKKVNHQTKKYTKSSTISQKIYSSGANPYFLVKHYHVDWEQFDGNHYLQAITPLFRIKFGTFKVPYAVNNISATEKQLRRSEKIGFVTMNTRHAKRAHASVIINKNRELIFRTISELSFNFKDRNLISIYFEAASSFVAKEQLAHHLRLSLSKVMNQPIKQQASRAKTQGNNFFSMLYPFSLSKWNYLSIQGQLQRIIENSHKSLLKNRFLDIYLCHHYKLLSSKHPKQIYKDLHDFKEMQKKFDFFAVISQMQSHNLKKKQYKCKNLIRILKWRTIQTQEYLVFLINQFGQDRMQQAIILFEQAYRQCIQNRVIKDYQVK